MIYIILILEQKSRIITTKLILRLKHNHPAHKNAPANELIEDKKITRKVFLCRLWLQQFTNVNIECAAYFLQRENCHISLS